MVWNNLYSCKLSKDTGKISITVLIDYRTKKNRHNKSLTPIHTASGDLVLYLWSNSEVEARRIAEMAFNDYLGVKV